VLIDVAIPGDRNVIKKEAEKILKYKDLIIEIQRMWNVKTKVMPVIIGATGTISKSFRKYFSSIPKKHEVKELQKNLYWEQHTYFRKYQCRSTKQFNIEDSVICTCTLNSKRRIAVTLYILKTWFVSGTEV
jgi:hypothetical protein